MKKVKTRKFLWTLLPMMAAALMTTACSSDDDSTSVSPKPAADQTVKSIPYTVTVGQGTTTRATVADDVTLQFAAGDKLYVENKDANVYGCLTLQSGDAGKATGATFSGNLYYTGIELTDNLQLTATLVGEDDELANVSDGKVMGFENYPTTVCATMAEAVQKYSILTGSSTYGEKSFALSQQTAFMKFSVTLEDGTTNGATVPVVIKNGNTTIGTGNVTATGTQQFIDIKADFVLPVANGTTISDDAKMWVGSVGTPADESIDLGGSNTLVAGKVYEVADKTKDFVRLWEGGPVWATKNLGASSVSGYGKYYAWGEITGYAQSESHDFSWANYTLCNGSSDKLTKYNFMSYYGTNPDNKTEFADYNYVDDAAYAASNGTWRIPTSTELDNLRSNTTGAGKTVNSVKGRTFTGKTTGYTGKAIFLPAAGFRMGTEHNDLDPYAYGDYWSSSINPFGSPSYASYLNIGSGGDGMSSYDRCAGQSVRPVRTN